MEKLWDHIRNKIMTCDYKKLQKSGEAYPRTCPECGLGPCKQPNPPANDLPGIDEQIARITARISLEQELNDVDPKLSDIIMYKAILNSLNRLKQLESKTHISAEVLSKLSILTRKTYKDNNEQN